LFVWENELLRELLEDLEGHRGTKEDDVWQWRLEDNGRFIVKSMYKKFEGLMLEARSITDEQGRVFLHIWKSLTPCKVLAFSWKLLHDRIPTKVNLAHMQVLPPETSSNCVMCAGVLESLNHLFLHCVFSKEVWDEFLKMVGFLFCVTVKYVHPLGVLERGLD